MKRRRPVLTNQPPVSLRRFDPADWPELDDVDQGDEAAFAAWSAARKAWMAEYGWAPGDELDELRERYHERRRHWYGIPHPTNQGDPHF